LSNFHNCDVAVKMLPPFAANASKEEFQQVRAIKFLNLVMFRRLTS
jgi:hypothetical protein